MAISLCPQLDVVKQRDRMNVQDATGFLKKKEQPDIPSSLPSSASDKYISVCAPRLSDSTKCFADPILAFCQYQQREGDMAYSMRMVFPHYLVSHFSSPPFPMSADHQWMVKIPSTADGRRDTGGEASQFSFSSTTYCLCDFRFFTLGFLLGKWR